MAAGRPRAFDKEEALEAAMLVFWRNGYAGASMADLTHAMGINKPSLYAAYGNKEQLFVAATEQYVRLISPSFDYLYAPDQPLDERIRAHLKSVSQRFCDPDLPRGCLLANSTCESAGDSISSAGSRLVSHINEETQQRLTEFFSQEEANGMVSRRSSPETLALYLMSVNSGMAILARSGATARQLDAIIEHVVTTIT